MSIATDQARHQARDHLRTVRVETELRFRATPERVFRAMTDDTPAWFPRAPRLPRARLGCRPCLRAVGSGHE